MENLSKDELMLIAIEFDLPDLLRFCSSSKRINDKICGQNDIWIYKLNREFSPEEIKELRQKTHRETYTLLYQLRQLQEIPIFKKYSLIDLYNRKFISERVQPK